MAKFTGEYFVEFSNDGFCLPDEFGGAFKKSGSDKLVLFEIEVDELCPQAKGQWGLAELGRRKEIEHWIVIERPSSYPWRIMFPSEVAEKMGLRDGDTLVLAGMFEYVNISTLEVYQRVIDCMGEILMQRPKHDES